MLEPEELVEKYASMVYSLALRLLGNPHDAEDLAQETLIRAVKALPSFRGDSEPGTWIYRITVNLWKNRVRSEKRRSAWKTFSLNHSSDDGEEEKPLEIADKEPPLDRDLEKDETKRALETALAELDPEDRAILVLRELDDRPYEAIAEILQLPLGTVKSRLSRAREALRAKLKPHLGVEP
jgi:RNA polymerase sigma-70 factor (ECF subfamily)